MTSTNSLFSGGTDGNSTSSTCFFALGGGFYIPTTEALVALTLPLATTLSNLQLTGSTGFGSGDTVSTRNNGAAGNQSINWSTEISTPGTMQDTTHTDSVVANDTADLSISRASSFLTIYSWGVASTAASPMALYVLGFNNTSSTFSTTTFYAALQGTWSGMQADSSEDSSDQTPIEEPGTLTNLQASITSASSGTATIRLRHSTANGNQVISVSPSTTGMMMDTTHTDSVTLGDVANYAWSSTNASGYLNLAAVVFEGTTSAHNLTTGTSLDYQTATQVYLAVAGPTADQSADSIVSLNAPYAFNGSQLRVLLKDANDCDLVSRNNAANGNQVVSSNADGFFMDVTHSDSFASGHTVNYGLTKGGIFVEMVGMTFDDGSDDGGAVTPAPFVSTTFGDVSDASFSSNTTFSANFTNGTSEPGIVVAVVTYGSLTGTPAVSSITAPGSLTWAQRGHVDNTSSGAHNASIEVWWADAPSGINASNASEAFGVDFTSTIDDSTITFFFITGCHSGTAPFDSDTSLPVTGFNTTSTTPPVLDFTTLQEDDLILFVSTTTSGNASGTPTGWTAIAKPQNAGGTNNSYAGIYYKRVSAQETGSGVVDASGSNQISWTALVDAFTANGLGGGNNVNAFIGG